MASTIVSYDGYIFTDHGWTALLPQDAVMGQYGIASRVTPRPGSTTVIAPGEITPRRITVIFQYEGDDSDGILFARDELIGALNPRDQTPRELIGERYDATQVTRTAKVELVDLMDADGSLNELRVVFMSEEPEWFAVDSESATDTFSSSPDSMTVTNAGQAPVWPIYSLRWTVQRTVKTSVIGWQYRKRMTLTNDLGRAIPPFPYLIDLGNTATLVDGGKALVNGDDLRILRDGEDLPRTLVGWYDIQGYAWVLLPGMDADEVMTLDIIYGNASAGAPETIDPRDLGIDIGTYSDIAQSGLSTTTVAGFVTNWETDRWVNGIIHFQNGAAAGNHNINSNTATTITFTSNGGTPSVGDSYTLLASTNTRWNYAVRQTDRKSDLSRGRWSLSSTRVHPQAIKFDVPGAWRPELILENRDSVGQYRFSMIDVGGGDTDPFAILDARRTWEGRDNEVPNPGTADGVALAVPWPATSMEWEYQLDTPNGFVEMFTGVRASGSEDWASAYTDASATSGYATRNFGTLDLTDFGDVYQIAQALLPRNEIEIGLDWKGDDGSATSGSTTTMVDAAKSWDTNQFADGRIRMLSGSNAGKTRSITSNSSTTITHAAFGAANADGDRYRIDNTALMGKLRDGSYLTVYLDNSDLVDSGLGAETAVYDLTCAIYIGAGPAGYLPGQHRVLMGYGGTRRRLLISALELVQIDAATRQIRIQDISSGEYTATLTDPSVIVQYHDGTAWRRSANWLPLGVGEQTVWVSESHIGTLRLDVEYHAAWLG